MDRLIQSDFQVSRPLLGFKGTYLTTNILKESWKPNVHVPGKQWVPLIISGTPGEV